MALHRSMQLLAISTAATSLRESMKSDTAHGRSKNIIVFFRVTSSPPGATATASEQKRFLTGHGFTVWLEPLARSHSSSEFRGSRYERQSGLNPAATAIQRRKPTPRLAARLALAATAILRQAEGTNHAVAGDAIIAGATIESNPTE